METNTLQTPSLLSRMFQRKNLDEVIAASENAEHKLKRTLGAFDLVIFGVGAMIGAGIFVLTGAAAAGSEGHVAAGPALSLSYMITALVCTFCALAYAEFSSMVPISGSAYTYTYSTLGQMMAWVIGWALVLEYAVGNMAVAVGWTGHIKEFLSQHLHYTIPSAFVQNTIDVAFEASKIPKENLLQVLPLSMFGHSFFITVYQAFNVPAFLIVLAVTALLYVGVQESARSAAVMVFLKTAVVLLFIAVGGAFLMGQVTQGHFEQTTLHANWFANGWKTFAPNGWAGILTGASTVFFAYIGFDAVSTAAEETKNPQKDIPIGIIGSLAICTLLYIAVSAIITGIVPLDHINKEAAVAGAMTYVGYGWASILINIGAIAGLTSVLLVLQMGGVRIFYAIARDNLLPASLSKVHPKFQTPHVCTVIVGAFVALFAAMLPITLLAEMCNIGTLGAFLVVCIGVMILRYSDPERPRPFKVPFGLLIPALGCLGCLAVMCGIPDFQGGWIGGLPSTTWVVTGGWFLIGMVIYFSYGLPNSLKAQKKAALAAQNTPELVGVKKNSQPTPELEPVS